MWNDDRTMRATTSSIRGTDGLPVIQNIETIQTFSWGDGVIRRITDPTGACLTNTFTYTAAGLTESVATRPLALQRGTNCWSYGFDQVKNVTELFDATGALAATYDYAPFGSLTFATGPAADLNPLTFSSEINDSPLGLIYYNYRHLNVLDGRWVNRDPIEETGGLNIYLFALNDQNNVVDALGTTPKTPITDLGDHGMAWVDWVSYLKSEGLWTTMPGSIKQGHTKTTYEGLVIAHAVHGCCCAFTILEIGLKIGTWFRNDWYGGMPEYHEVNGHRAHAKRIQSRFAASQSDKTCCYTKGLGPFESSVTQTQTRCNQRAAELSQVLADRASEWNHDVGHSFDKKAGNLVGSTMDDQKKYAAEALLSIENKIVEDWQCGDTMISWF